MDLRERETLGGDAARHWYYRAKSAAMLRMLRGHPIGSVLDVGAGDGFFSRILLQRTDCRAAVCVDPNYAADHAKMDSGKPISFLRNPPRFDGDLILMMDVLEHVADDRALLIEYAAHAKTGTRMLVTVPAMPWIWSGHDDFLGHYRRYTLNSLRRVLVAAGLRPREMCYYFAFVLPVASAMRLGPRLVPALDRHPRSDMRRHGRAVNTALLAACMAELPIFRANRIAGLSAFALCETG